MTLAGVLTNVRPYYTKGENKLMYFLTLEDRTGTISVTVFPRNAAELTKTPEKDSVVLIAGRASHRDRINKRGSDDEEGGGSASVEIAADKISEVAALGTTAAVKDNAPGQARLLVPAHPPGRDHAAARPPPAPHPDQPPRPQPPRPAHRRRPGQGTRRVQPPVRVAPNAEVVDLLRHRLGRPEAVWTE